MKVVVRLQMKLFFRPKGLKISSDEVNEHLVFNINKAGSLAVKNQTPYYVTFRSAVLSEANATDPINIEMLAPFEQKDIPIDGTKKYTKINYKTINDSGNDISGTATLGNS